ncbi:MAG: hypothetical protein QXZ41_06360 [Ignisphaera sp.]|uniref:Endonuclease n=1 Tax=Ignisphaera aggregans TaxID=334771 RepID=A0A7C4NTG5_9CREN
MRSRINEDVIVQKLVDKLSSIGFEVHSHVRLNGLEIDVLVLEPQEDRPLAYVYEVKSRPTSKLLKQISKRLDITDYLYIVVPINLYPWVLKKLDPFVGLVLYVNNDLYIFRRAEFLGKGNKLVEEFQNTYNNHKFKV